MRLKEILTFMGLILHRSPDALACFIGDTPSMAKGIEI